MDSLNDVIAFLHGLEGKAVFIYPVIATLILYVVYRKREELSWHALQNSWASFGLYGVNALIAVLFYEDIYWAFQTTYEALGIPTLPPGTWDGVPLVVAAIIALLAQDLVDYWAHRIMHTKWGWPTHAAHHSDTYVNAFTSFRIHYLEILMMVFMHITLLTWMQLPELIPVLIVFSTLHNVYVHLDLDYDHGPFKYLIASPAFHRWHHADVEEAYGKNLANLVPLYDVIFGTYYNPGLCRAPMGALSQGVEDKSITAILTYPFREWNRLIRQSRDTAQPDLKERDI